MACEINVFVEIDLSFLITRIVKIINFTRSFVAFYEFWLNSQVFFYSFLAFGAKQLFYKKKSQYLFIYKIPTNK